MGRPAKGAHPMSIRMDDVTFNRLSEYCTETGIPKTKTIENAVNMYLDDYEKKQEQLKNLHTP